MCGSGTLLGEAWLKAGNIPAGTLRKHWGFSMLPDHDRRLFVKVKFEEDNKIKVVRGGLIRGSDIDPNAVKMTRRNIARIPGGDELLRGENAKEALALLLGGASPGEQDNNRNY